MNTNIEKFEKRYSQNPNYYGSEPSTLFTKTKAIIKSHFTKNKKQEIKVTELGAGQGRDSIALAQLLPTAIIYCTDGSDSAVKTSRENVQASGLLDRIKSQVQDVFAEYDKRLKDSDLIFANMCLHYHKDTTNPQNFLEETQKVFENATNNLSPSGLFVFAVNSDKDEYFGKGDEIGQNSGVWRFDDRIRHFFTKDFIEKLLNRNDCKVLYIDHVTENYDPNINRGLVKNSMV